MTKKLNVDKIIFYLPVDGMTVRTIQFEASHFYQNESVAIVELLPDAEVKHSSITKKQLSILLGDEKERIVV